MVEYLKNEPSRPVCIGRAIIDIPTYLEVSYGMTNYARWFIQAQSDSEESFLQRLNERRGELMAKKNSLGGTNLEVDKEVRGGWKGRIFLYGRDSFRSIATGEEKQIETVRIEAHLHAEGVSFDITASGNLEEQLIDLEKLISKLRVREEDEIPKASGFCFEQGFVAEPDNSTLSEGITLFGGSPRLPGLAIVIDITAGTKAPETYLERAAANSVRLELPWAFKNFRTGPRKIDVHDGGEVVERVKEKDGRSNHSFKWESNPIPTDVYRPQITMELSTGHRYVLAEQKTPLTDAEAIALWDRFTSTLRNRPID